MRLPLDQEVKGMTGKEGIETWSLAELVEDQIGYVFGAGFVFENVGAAVTDSVLFKAASFDLGWGAFRPGNEAENGEWPVKLLITKQLNFFLGGPEGTSCMAFVI